MSASMPMASCDVRATGARRWALEMLGLEHAAFAPASADASFRRYFRVSLGRRSWIVMDAPPEHEDCRPFLRVAELMREAGLRVPVVLAQDFKAGYLLLSDLGKQTCLALVDDSNAEAFYTTAIDALILWQKASRPRMLPDYDAALLGRELALFPDWYLARHLGTPLDQAGRAHFDAIAQVLVEAAVAQPRVFVHRDFMLRNLMPGNPAPGVLDFQDAVYGPVTYDPVSLVKDAFLSWPAPRVEHWLRVYHARAVQAGVPVTEWSRFQRDCDWMGLQRHLKVLGIFARLTHRDGKAKYAADTPRFVRYVMEVAPRYPELRALTELFETRVLPRVDVA
ncbi:MAG TPA: phosphotransferase [Nevskiaceae bacterium]|nr:phosphotransferase [Nevskiaceae bacterium]